MKSMQYHYWVSQCQKGFRLSLDEDNYIDLAEETLHLEGELYVYRINDVIYAQLFPSTYIIN